MALASVFPNSVEKRSWSSIIHLCPVTKSLKWPEEKYGTSLKHQDLRQCLCEHSNHVVCQPNRKEKRLY